MAIVPKAENPGQVLNEGVQAIRKLPPPYFHGAFAALQEDNNRANFLVVSDNDSEVVGGKKVDIFVQTTWEGPYYPMTCESRDFPDEKIETRLVNGWSSVVDAYQIQDGDECVFVKKPRPNNSFLLAVIKSSNPV